MLKTTFNLQLILLDGQEDSMMPKTLGTDTSKQTPTKEYHLEQAKMKTLNNGEQLQSKPSDQYLHWIIKLKE